MGDRAHARYTRVSKDKVGAAFGVESQAADIEDFTSDELGIEVTRDYQDNDRSAYSGVERPAYRRLLADIAAGKIRSVTVWHANRLHRSLEEVTSFITLARRHRVKLYSVARGGEYNLEKAEGRKALLSDTVDAQYESEHRGERVALARKRQARRGDHGGGVRPYGWGVETGRVRSVCINPKAPTMERIYEDRPVLDKTQHNPEEAAEIRRMAADLLSGVSMRQILRSLAERGVKTVAQKEGKVIRRNGKEMQPAGWNSRTVRQILTSPRVSGHTVYRGQIIARGVLPEILPEEVRQALIELFENPARKATPGNTPKWLGSLIYRCGVCNDGTTMTSRYANDGQRVYRCKEKGHCQWDAESLDAYIAEVAIRRLARADVADLIPRSGEPVDITALQEERKAIEARKRRMTALYARGGMDDEDYEEARAIIAADLAAVEAKLKEAVQDSPLTPFLHSTSVEEVRAIWDGLSLGRRREIVRLLMDITLPPLGRGRRVTEERLKTIKITPPRKSETPKAA